MAHASRGWTTIVCVSTIAVSSVIAGLAARSGGAASSTAPTIAPPAATAAVVSTLAAAPAALGQVRDCIYGISKDVCEGRLKGEQTYETGCDDAPIRCRTFHLEQGSWEFSLQSSNLICQTTPESERGWCDEFRDQTDGRFKSRVNLVLRQQEPCRFRGTLDGEAEYRMNDGSVYKGRFIGLVGCGADRTPACGTSDAHSCESCLDIQWVNASDQPYWRFGVEVIFDGSRIDMPTGQRCRLNISGALTSPGGIDGPERLDVYRFVGTADGVLIYVCN